MKECWRNKYCAEVMDDKPSLCDLKTISRHHHPQTKTPDGYHETANRPKLVDPAGSVFNKTEDPKNQITKGGGDAIKAEDITHLTLRLS